MIFLNLLIIPNRIFTAGPAKLLAAQELVPHLTVEYKYAEQITEEMMVESEIIFGCPPPELLSLAVNLKWHHLPNAGIEPYGNLALYANRNVVLTNASGVFGLPIAEHVVGMFLALSRQFPYYVRNQTEHVWQRRNDVRELYGATVAILGLGDLGQTLAKRLSGFDCTLLGVRKNILNKPPFIQEVYTTRRMNEALSRADYVAACLPHTPETVGLMNEAAFNAMKPDSIFVNVGRGSLVVESALASALKENRIMGAGIDVADKEPLSPDSPLWDCENLLITPHGSSASPMTQERNFALFLELLERYINGKKMTNTVDFFRGY